MIVTKRKRKCHYLKNSSQKHPGSVPGPKELYMQKLFVKITNFKFENNTGKKHIFKEECKEPYEKPLILDITEDFHTIKKKSHLNSSTKVNDNINLHTSLRKCKVFKHHPKIFNVFNMN